MLLNENTYEEIFMLYIDNELTASENAAVVAFAQSNPQYSEALKILQDTKLHPSLIPYEDKVLLYRFDSMDTQLDSTFKQSLYKKEARIIQPIFNKKMLVALSSIAALFLVVIGYTIFENNTSNNTLARIAKKNIIQNQKIAFSLEEKLNAIKNDGIITRDILPKKQILSIRSKAIFIELPTRSINNVVSSQAAKNILSELAANTTELNNTNSMNISDRNIENNAIAINQDNTNLADNNVVPSDKDQSSEDYTVLNTDHSDKIIYIANLEIDSEKLRGISRKVSALFKRNRIEKEK